MSHAAVPGNDGPFVADAFLRASADSPQPAPPPSPVPPATTPATDIQVCPDGLVEEALWGRLRGLTVPPLSALPQTSLAFTAMEFRRVARENKDALWSVSIALIPDRFVAAGVLTTGIRNAWSSAEMGSKLTSDMADRPSLKRRSEPGFSDRLIILLYRAVLEAAAGSLLVGAQAATEEEDPGMNGNPPHTTPIARWQTVLQILDNQSPMTAADARDVLYAAAREHPETIFPYPGLP